jgi:hypothetical protein
MLIAAAALGALILSPIVATGGGAAAKETKAVKVHVTKHTVKHVRTVRAPRYIRAQAPSAFSPYAHRPEYDAHIGGAVIGSDPDPRVRGTLRREYCEDSPSAC